MLVFIVALAFSFYPVTSIATGKSPQALMAQGNYYLNIMDYNRALNYNRNALQADPLFPEVNLNMGNCFIKTSQIDSARYYFNREIRFHPARDKAYTNLATINYLDKNYQESENLASKAIDHGSAFLAKLPERSIWVRS